MPNSERPTVPGAGQRRRRVTSDGLWVMGERGDRSWPATSYVSPVARPDGSTLMRAAAGTFGRPGMVMILPQMTTTNPAPADILSSLTLMRNPLGRPRRSGSSDRDIGVLAMHMGRSEEHT